MNAFKIKQLFKNRNSLFLACGQSAKIQDFERGNDLARVVKKIKESRYQWGQYIILAEVPLLTLGPSEPQMFLHLCISFLKKKKNLSFILSGTLVFIFSLCFIAALRVTVEPLLVRTTVMTEHEVPS